MTLERIMTYCRRLECNNNRPWFHENHGEYEIAGKDFASLLERLRFTLCDAAPALEPDIMYGRVKDWVYRIPRDARLHTDLPPYNPSFRAYISADRKSWLPIGYFICIGANELEFGTGVWCHDTEGTNRVRDYISANSEEFFYILQENGLYPEGERLKGMPRGYSADVPAAAYLKMKNWFVEERPAISTDTEFDTVERLVSGYVKRMEPFRQFLLRACREKQTYKESLRNYYRESNFEF